MGKNERTQKQGKKKRVKLGMMNRYRWIMVALQVVALLIVCKLFMNTIVHADGWNELAKSGIRDSVVIYPERGNILAEDRSILSANIKVYSPEIDFNSQSFKADTLRKYIDSVVERVTEMDPTQKPKELKEEILTRLDSFEVIKKHNTRVSKIDKDKRGPADTFKRYGKWRRVKLLTNIYNEDRQYLLKCKFFNVTGGKYTLTKNPTILLRRPFGKLASQCIGATKEERVGNNKTVFRGETGLERALDTLLYGKNGWGSTVSSTKSLTTWEVEPAQRGYDVVTTINIHMQDIVETELEKMCQITKSEWATAVLMDVKTGEIKAISNLQRDSTKRGEVFYREGLNHALMGYDPGSVMKPISMMIALEDKIVGLNVSIPTGSSFSYAGGRPITDSHAYSSLTPKQIIAYSSNIGMSKIIIKGYGDDPRRYRKRLEDIGMFEPLNLGIYGERLPYIPQLGTKNKDRIDMSRVCYGYATRIPPIYTLSFYNAIANGGKFVRPRIVKELISDGQTDTVFDVSYVRERICSEEVAAQIRDFLKAVVWDPHGTGRALQNNFVSISGKTGTAYQLDNGGYNTSKKRYAFCGFFPSDAPQYSCIVVMQGGPFGAARSSGTVLMNIALKLYARGLLNQFSDYKDMQEHNGAKPIVTRMTDESKSALMSGLNVTSTTQLKPKSIPDNGVPSAIGMSLRDAVMTLEKAGLNVAATEGSGNYVYSQTPAAGAKYKKGDKITLKLRNSI